MDIVSDIEKLKQKYLNKIVKIINSEWDYYGTYKYIYEIKLDSHSNNKIYFGTWDTETIQPKNTKGVFYKKIENFEIGCLYIYYDHIGLKSESQPLNCFPGVKSFNQEIEIVEPSEKIMHQFITGAFDK